MATQQLRNIGTHDAVVLALEDNFAQKIAFFPTRHKAMQVHRHGDVAYVDTKVHSDTFNCAFGGAFTRRDSKRTAEAVFDDYRNAQLPMAWWVGPSSDPVARQSILEGVGFYHNEVEVGMAAMLADVVIDVMVPPELKISPVATKQHIEDFGRVLASVFEPFDEEVVRYYGFIGEQIEATDSQAKLFIGYAEGVPAAIGGAFITERIAGIYDIATNPQFRKRGYGTAMTAVALQAARDFGHKAVGLQASSDGLAIYKRLGFKELCEFHVYGISG